MHSAGRRRVAQHLFYANALIKNLGMQPRDSTGEAIWPLASCSSFLLPSSSPLSLSKAPSPTREGTCEGKKGFSFLQRRFERGENGRRATNVALVAEEGLAEFGFGICQHAGLAKLHCHVVERIDTLLGVIRLRASEYVVAAGHLELPRFLRAARCGWGAGRFRL